LIEWAFYLKKRHITRVDVVLNRIPQNPNELVFILEVALQLLILKKIHLNSNKYSTDAVAKHPMALIALN